MNGTLHLIVTTPGGTLVDAGDVRSVRARDAGGAFGILPGHAPLVAALPPSVLHWRAEGPPWHHAALGGGVLLVGDGEVRVACREGLVGDDLEQLADVVRDYLVAERESARETLATDVALHARALRRLIGALGHGGARTAPR